MARFDPETDFLGVTEQHKFTDKLAQLIQDDEMRERFMRGLCFILSRDPLGGQLTGKAGILGHPSQGDEFGITPVVVYYSFDAVNVTLEDVVRSH